MNATSRYVWFHAVFVVLVVLVGLASCTGSISSEGAAGGIGPMAGTGGTSPTGEPTNESAATLPLQRLSQREYTNTIRDLLGNEFVADVATFAESLRQKSGNAGFDVPLDDVTGHVSDGWVVAEALAARAAPKLVAASSCKLTQTTAAGCAEKIIVDFGRRAFRRPLEPVEVEALRGVFVTATSTDGLDHEQGIALVLQGILLSPHFLYHWEAGSAPPVAEAGLIKLSGHQVASRLSYLLWGTMPDPTLFAAADAQQLGSPDGVAAQVERMVRDRLFAETASDFHRQWLAVGNLANLVRNGSKADPKRYDDFTQNKAAYAQSMNAELDAFVAHVLRGPGDGRLRTLLTAPSSFATGPVTKIYGPGGQRAGILTQAAFLTSKSGPQTSSPILRGVWIFKHLLCRHIGEPNADDVMQAKKELPPVSRPESTRENFDRLTSSRPVCLGCHRVLNPLGWPFEHYGAIGEFRDQDNGRPVDSTATLTLDGQERTVGDAIQLVQALGDSEEARQCVASQWFRYALGRRETEPDMASLGIAARRFGSTGGDVRDLLVAITQSKAFRYRLP